MKDQTFNANSPEAKAYSRMVDRVRAYDDKSLKEIWKAINTRGCHPEDGYYAGDNITFPFVYWEELIVHEIERRGMSALEVLKEKDNDAG